MDVTEAESFSWVFTPPAKFLWGKEPVYYNDQYKLSKDVFENLSFAHKNVSDKDGYWIEI